MTEKEYQEEFGKLWLLLLLVISVADEEKITKLLNAMHEKE